MKIYEFSTWGCRGNELFSVTVIEVEEKPKTYIGIGTRINKSDIDVLQHNYGNRMYRLDNNPIPYIEAMVKHCNGKVEVAERDLKLRKETLSKWETLYAEETELFKWCEDCKHFCNSDMGGEGECDIDKHRTWYGCPAEGCKNFEFGEGKCSE